MHIYEVLHHAWTKHTAEGHPSPTSLYLGSREEAALLRAINFIERKKSPSHRLEWQGLQVYRVDAEHHIAFR